MIPATLAAIGLFAVACFTGYLAWTGKPLEEVTPDPASRWALRITNLTNVVAIGLLVWYFVKPTKILGHNQLTWLVVISLGYLLAFLAFALRR